MPAHTEVSDTPFIAPSTQLTGPVEFQVEGEADDKQISKAKTQKEKEKKKSRKSRKEDKDNKRRASSPSLHSTRVKQVDNNPPVHLKPPPDRRVFNRPGPNLCRWTHLCLRPSTQQEVVQTSSTGQALPHAQPSTSGFSDLPVAGSYRCAPEPDTFDLEHLLSDTEYSDDEPDSGEGEVSSDTVDKPELTEDVNCREIC